MTLIIWRTDKVLSFFALLLSVYFIPHLEVYWWFPAHCQPSASLSSTVTETPQCRSHFLLTNTGGCSGDLMLTPLSYVMKWIIMSSLVSWFKTGSTSLSCCMHIIMLLDITWHQHGIRSMAEDDILFNTRMLSLRTVIDQTISQSLLPA